MRLRSHITLALLLVTLSPQLSEARIRLAMRPVRERVELQLDHGGYTLVEEERIVPLLKSSAKRGNDSIDFSWSNTAIDKDSMYDRVPVSKTFTFDWYRNGQLNPEKPLASPTLMHCELTTDAISVDFSHGGNAAQGCGSRQDGVAAYRNEPPRHERQTKPRPRAGAVKPPRGKHNIGHRIGVGDTASGGGTTRTRCAIITVARRLPNALSHSPQRDTSGRQRARRFGTTAIRRSR